jgi:4-hydroxymandelate oxidase
MAITRRDVLLSAGAAAGVRLFPASNGVPPGQSAEAADAVNLFDFEPIARRKLSPMAWEYISGGAGDELTLRWNRESYDRIKLRPRILVDVSKLDTRTRLLGREFQFPILLAPAAYQRMVHRQHDGDDQR